MPPAIQAAVLQAARGRVPAITSCAVGWLRAISTTESAVVFTCMGSGGPYEGAMYQSAADGVTFASVGPVDRRAAFTHNETSGDRSGAQGHYEIVSGVVNRNTIDAMTVGYADGSLGLMQIGDARPRMYAFVHTGALSAVRNITAYVGNHPAFVFPPYPPAPR